MRLFSARKPKTLATATPSSSTKTAARSTTSPERIQQTLRAETAFKKAEIYVRVRKFDDALAEIDQAIRLNPSDAEFKIQRVYIQYLLDARKGPNEQSALAAIKQVMTLMKDNANIASGYLVLGHLHRQSTRTTSRSSTSSVSWSMTNTTRPLFKKCVWATCEKTEKPKRNGGGSKGRL